MTIAEARYYAGYVLRDVEEEELVRDTFQYYGIELFTKQDVVKSVLVYVPVDCVFKVYDDTINQSKYTYDMVLKDAEYNVFYPVDGSDVRRQMKVSRDLICKWYYEHRISASNFYYDLMRVPITSLGPISLDMVYRSVSWQSFLIQPGLVITLSVRNADVRYVPKSYEIDGCLLESKKLENYVNINLSEDVYPVSYKSAATGWRVKTETVPKYMVIQDYVSSVRAKLNQMSLDEWMGYIHNIDVELEM